MRYALLLPACLALSSCFDEVRCTNDATCPISAPVCVEGVCAVAEGEGDRSEGEGEAGEGEGEGDVAEGEGDAGEGEGEGEGDCRVTGCDAGLGCVDEGSVDVGRCVPPADTPADCQGAGFFFAREDQAPYVWRPLFVQAFEGSSAAVYNCSPTGERAVLFNFQFLDDENDAGHADGPVGVRSIAGTTTPPPANDAVAFSGTDGHIGSMSVAVCLGTNITDFAFAMDDDQGHTSNAACITVP